jgi:hypothetical protein
MQIHRSPFHVNKLDMENPIVLIQPEQADTTKRKSVVTGEPRPERDGESTSHKVVMEKLPDGEEMITITIRGSTTGSRTGKAEGLNLAHDDGKQEPNAMNQRQAIQPPPGRLDHHGGPPQAT